MLIALLTILFLGSSATGLLDYISESSNNVKAEVVSDDRRKAALATLKSMRKAAKARNSELKRTAKQLSSAFTGANTSDETLEAIWNSYFVAASRYDHELIDLRFELKDQLTRQEWEAVYSR